MCTCVLRCGCFLLDRLCSLLRSTVLLPALPDVHLSVQREVQVQPLCDFRLETVATSDHETPLTPGEWQHGWQFHASSPLEQHFRETVLLARLCPDDQVAHLRSHSGPGSSDVLCGAPYQPHLFMERLRLPLDITDARCECSCRLDFEGRHRGACPRSGRLRTRAVGPERSLARVCREAGVSVRCNTKLRDMNVAVSAMDERSIEVLASGLPLFHGAQLAIDVTLRSPLTAQAWSSTDQRSSLASSTP